MMASMKVCFAVGLFMIAWFPTGFSKDIPDNVVYTEVKKKLVNGTKGILTCQFKGTPNAVYWIKGSDSDITMSFMKWAYGSKSGARYEDGSCDMDENFSLIINNVEYADAGHYYCRVSSYKGVLIHNFTDVTITSYGVKTQQSVAFQMREVGVIPCQVNIRPKIVSWLNGVNTTLVTTDLSRDAIEIGGTGYNEGLFNITKEYSLVISDVTIQHEGFFFCEVTDFDTDKLYWDKSLLTVFAQPTMPFPTIQECPMGDHSNCIITTDSSVILTCNVNQYYPDISLVFMHGSELVESLTTLTWNNTDGTKNKSVTISGDISRNVYKCIASGIPGFDVNDESLSSARVIQLREQSSSPMLAILIVPIMICLTMVLIVWMRLRKRGKPLSKMERYMQDHISYVELWKFVQYIIDKRETPKLVDLITLLNNDEGSMTKMDQDYYYQKLCRWKETCDQTINQRNVLYDGCQQCGLHESAEMIEEFWHDISTEVPRSDFEHIIWHISDPCKIKKFLKHLGIDMDRESELAPKKEIIKEAVDHLETWKPSRLGFVNPAIIISSTMEMFGYCSADNNFFQIPTKEKEKLSDDEVKIFARDTSNHWQKLARMDINNEGVMNPPRSNENNKVLSDTEKMLRDWWDDMECSNYDKRRTLQRLSDGLSDETESPVKEGNCRLGVSGASDGNEKEPGEAENLLNKDEIASTENEEHYQGSQGRGYRVK